MNELNEIKTYIKTKHIAVYYCGKRDIAADIKQVATNSRYAFGELAKYKLGRV